MAVTDLRDTRVLIPRTRRALEGLTAAGSGFSTSTYDDDTVNAAVADAIASLLLYTGSFFDKRLEVVERDEHYMAPIAWRTSEELTEPEQALVAIQATLNHVYVSLVGQKQAETIRKGDEEWTWSISASVLSERLKGLRADRDRALEQIAASGVALESYYSFIAERDGAISALIEPYVGASNQYGQQLDPRGFL